MTDTSPELALFAKGARHTFPGERCVGSSVRPPAPSFEEPVPGVRPGDSACPVAPRVSIQQEVPLKRLRLSLQY